VRFVSRDFGNFLSWFEGVFEGGWRCVAVARFGIFLAFWDSSGGCFKPRRVAKGSTRSALSSGVMKMGLGDH